MRDQSTIIDFGIHKGKQLSDLEEIFKQILASIESPESKKDILRCLNAQRALTQFLRSGRLLVK